METQIWFPAVTALGGALIGSVAPIVVGLINARAESRRERLRVAVQMAIEDHQHLMNLAQAKANAGFTVGVPPISAVFGYHLSVLEALQKSGTLKPADYVALRERSRATFEALSGEGP